MQTAKGSPSEFPLPKSPYQSAKSWCLFSGTKRVVSSATAANYNGQQRGLAKGSGQEDFPKRFVQQVSKSGALHEGQQVRPTQRTRVSAVTQERPSESPHQVLQSTSLAIPPISLPLPWPWYSGGNCDNLKEAINSLPEMRSPSGMFIARPGYREALCVCLY